MGGAELVRGTSDVLELLPAAALPLVPCSPGERPALEPRLARLLERVGAGMDTPEKLIGPAPDVGELLLELTELELLGLVTRGESGRYVPRDSLVTYARRRSVGSLAARQREER
jgi:hypothetical protein